MKNAAAKISSDISYQARAFRKLFGMKPAEIFAEDFKDVANRGLKSSKSCFLLG